jgi:hypothetical protein
MRTGKVHLLIQKWSPIQGESNEMICGVVSDFKRKVRSSILHLFAVVKYGDKKTG